MAARRVLEEAYAAGQWRLGDADPLMVQISHDLGVVAEELGNRHEARKAFGRVAEHGPGALGADHPGVARARAYLGQDQNLGAVRAEPAQQMPPPGTPATYGPGANPSLEDIATRFRLEPGPVPRPGNFVPTPPLSDEPTTALHFDAPEGAGNDETSAFEVIPLGTRGGRVQPPTDQNQQVWTAPPGEAAAPQPGPVAQPGPVDQPTTVHPIVAPRTEPQSPASHTAPPGGFPAPPQAQPSGSYSAQPSGSYPAQPSGSYPAQPSGNFPAQPSGNFPAQPSGNFPAQRAQTPGGYQHPPLGAPYPPAHAPGGYPISPPPQPPAPPAYGKRGVGLFAAIAAILSAVIAVVALVFVLANRSNENGNDSNEPTLGGDPPGNVQLQDEGSRIQVTWTDPSRGTVSFMVAMAHPGEQLKPVGTLGPGETSYEMSALNPNLDYCFAVIAVYRNNQFATSEQACTERPSTGG
ncbi:hypothetical protein Ari01nite_72290 [Paractinoplanes rishiriensis]|uniref:Fibronectin type-III domain-containing protein n=2 Tax=Paractinoplanes rishiriensis TaxID=1050105 RepID=A0A919K557_9ACTN|nr:hypothetical protein Ari01nite_72290 [Actinoplanes rishiriensis]